MNQEGLHFEKPIHIIQDSANQLMAFKFFKDLEEIRQLIQEADLQPLEIYTNRSREELEEIKPGVTDAYNALVTKLRNDDFSTLEEFGEIMQEVWNVTH